VQSGKKILYGLSFAIYALSEYTLATGDPRGIKHATATFELVQRHCADPEYGGYFEMFERDWTRCGPGSGGGHRKTLDVHMHLMEAFTTPYECTGSAAHRRALVVDVDQPPGEAAGEVSARTGRDGAGHRAHTAPTTSHSPRGPVLRKRPREGPIRVAVLATRLDENSRQSTGSSMAASLLLSRVPARQGWRARLERRVPCRPEQWRRY